MEIFEVKLENITEYTELHGKCDNKTITLLGKTRNETFASFVDMETPNKAYSILLSDSHVATFSGTDIFTVRLLKKKATYSLIVLEKLKSRKETRYRSLTNQMKNIQKLVVFDDTLIIYSNNASCTVPISKIIDTYNGHPIC